MPTVVDISEYSKEQLGELTNAIAARLNALKAKEKIDAVVSKNLAPFEMFAAILNAPLISSGGFSSPLMSSLTHQVNGCTDDNPFNYTVADQGLPKCAKCALLKVSSEVAKAVDKWKVDKTVADGVAPSDDAIKVERDSIIKTQLAAFVPLAIFSFNLSSRGATTL